MPQLLMKQSKLGRLLAKWRALQVGHQGSYSIERLEGLDFYCKTTSRARVLLVCVVTPLPSLLVIFLVECLPLRPPSDGWKANWVFWIRLSITIFTMLLSAMAALHTFVPDLKATRTKKLIVVCGATCAYVATALVGANAIGFPIPLLWILGGSCMSIYVPSLFLLVFGSAPFVQTSPCRPNLQRFSRYFFAYMTLAGVFPCYKVLYEFIPTGYRGAVIVVLPLWRLAAKQFMVQATRELEDFMPEIVAFTVDFFSALFVSVCMSTSGSSELAVLFIAADVGLSVLELHDVREVSKSMKKLLQQKNQQLDNSEGELVSTILAVTRDPNVFPAKSLETMRLWACLPLPLPQSHTLRLGLLEASGVFGTPKASRTSLSATIDSQPQRHLQLGSVVPLPQETPPGPRFEDVPRSIQSQNASSKNSRFLSNSTCSSHAKRAKDVVRLGLQVLFHWEYVALVEYVECVVPLVFVAYKSVLANLPNVVYYPGGVDGWNSVAAVNILVFGALEIGSFFLLNCYLRRTFAFSPLYQLAFVLETQMHSVQTKLFIETVLLLQYELAHLGTDFSFRFQWLKE